MNIVFADEIRKIEEVLIAGQEARGYVMGAMDPRLADPAVLSYVVKSLCRHAQPTIAAQVIAGWVDHRPSEKKQTTWFRLMVGTRLEVSAS